VLLANVDHVKVGAFHDENVLPSAGNDTTSTKEESAGVLSTAIEVFYSASKKLVLVQQRAPCVPGRKAAFAKNLCDWVESSDFSQVILLTSTDAAKRGDAELNQESFRYFLTHPAVSTERAIAALQWKNTGLETIEESKEINSSGVTKAPVQKTDELPTAVLPSPRRGKANGTLRASKKMRPKVEGGGVTRAMFQRCRAQGVELLSLCVFATEGSNAEEGVSLAMVVDSYLTQLSGPRGLGFHSKPLQYPAAWAHVFGSQPDRSLYL